jgi:o-succinylbenzoate synthase
MRIVAIAARTVRWPIGGTGAARGRTDRAAVLLEVRTAGGTVGLGEAAPLPGMSLDTLVASERALAEFSALVPFEVSAAPDVTARDARALFAIHDPAVQMALAAAPPAARFAIEAALADALARESGVSLAALLAPRAGSAGPAARVPIAAVVDDAEAARRAYAAGVRCLKIKLNADDPIDRVLAIAAAVPNARLRIDANRTWPREEVADRLAALARWSIEYVEEPCRDAHLMLGTELPCRLALDESLAELSREAIATALRQPGLAAIVLKPTLLGGLAAAAELAALARRAGVAAVASHALEGPIGTAACAELALALGPGPAAGLAAHAGLDGWAISVAQLAGDHVRAAAAPGLGSGSSLDLEAAVRACPAGAAPPSQTPLEAR